MITLPGTFRKYDHIDKLNNPSVADILFGQVYVFPKIDGSNASVWLNNKGNVGCGSRRQKLSQDNDKQGFYKWVYGDSPAAINLRELVEVHPDLVFYGEWLVPHSLKTYHQDAWRQFYVFDVYSRRTRRYMHYKDYSEMIGDRVHSIEPLAVLQNPTESTLQELCNRNTFLIKEGEGVGEGIVIKNYEWANKFGRQPWGKIIGDEFLKQKGKPRTKPNVVDESETEVAIVDRFCTESFIRKEFAKVVNLVAEDKGLTLYVGDEPDVDGPSFAEMSAFIQLNRSKIIPRFLNVFYHELIEEEMVNILRDFKNPVIDFARLSKMMTMKAKKTLTEVF